MHHTTEGIVCNWNWSRPFLDREQTVVQELEERLNQVRLGEGEADRWIWHGHRGEEFSVKEGYEILLVFGSKLAIT